MSDMSRFVSTMNDLTYVLSDAFQTLFHLSHPISFGKEKFVLDNASLLLACLLRVSCVTNLRYFDRVLRVTSMCE